MNTPTQVMIESRSDRHSPTEVDWFPTDTVSDVLERAGFDPRYVIGVVIGTSYIRGYATQPVWPNMTIEVDDI